MSRLTENPRQRLMRALAIAAAEKGYAAVTIADIVGNARVSKRTFYEHFVDKEACLLAMYEQTSDRLMAAMSETDVPADQTWPDRVRSIAVAYLTALERVPAVNRVLLLEVQAAGERAYRLRARTLRRFADLLCGLVDEARRSHPEVRPLPAMVALAIVGGVNELMLHAVDPYSDARPDADPAARSFADLLEPVTDLVISVLSPRLSAQLPEIRDNGGETSLIAGAD